MKAKGSKSRKRSSGKNEATIENTPKVVEAVERGFHDDFEDNLEECEEDPEDDISDICDEMGDDLVELDTFEEEEERMEREEEEKARIKADRKLAKMLNKTVNYVDGDLLLERIRKYYSTDVMTEELASDIRKICERLSTSGKFCGYTYKDEMVADAFMHCYKAIYYKKYNPDLGYNPFSYITMVAYHSFQARIKYEKKEREKCDNYRDEHYDIFMADSADCEEESQCSSDCVC